MPMPMSASGAGVVLLRVSCAMLCGAILATHARAQEPSSQRAAAVATAQAAATSIESNLRFLPNLAQALAGTSARIATEGALARLYTALASDVLADEYWHKQQDDAQRAGDGSALGGALIARIEAALADGDYVTGEDLTGKLLVLAQASSSDPLLASANEYQGVLDRRHGRSDSAAAHQQVALELREKLGDLAGQAVALSNLGTVARDRGDFAQSLDYHLQALAIRERIDVRLDLSYRNLALLYRELDDEKTTREYFTKAIAAGERYADPGYYAGILGTYAGFLNDAHQYEQALTTSNEGLATSMVLGNRPGIGFEQLESGRALLGMKRVDDAISHLELALSTGRAINQREIIVRSELLLAEAALLRADLPRARNLLDDAFSRLDSSRMKPQLAQVYELRDRLAEAEHDTATAHDYAHRYMQLREELLGVRSTRQLAAVEVRKAREQAEQQLELAARTNELQGERIERGRLERLFGIGAIAMLAAVSALFMFLFFSKRRLYRALTARNREIDAQRAALADANRRLEEQADALYQAAITDPLTGVFNRAHLLARLGAMLASSNSESREMAVLMLDFDHFKQVNDKHGHLTGDRILVEAMQTISEQLEPDCLVGRFGGEEFIVAFGDRDFAASRQLAERLRESVAARMAALMPGMRPGPTISIGIALLSQMPAIQKIDPLIDAADRAMYAAKIAGRNQVRGMQLS